MAAPTEMTFEPFAEISKDLQFIKKEEKKEADARVLWDTKTELTVNHAIQIEYSLFFAYHSMHSFANCDRVALRGLACYFTKEMERQAACALLWSDYQSKRGGEVHLFPVSKPEHSFEDAKGDALCMMECKLALERLKYSKLDKMHKVAEETNDKHFQDLIEEKMGTQLLIIKQDADWVNQLRRVGKGHGTWDWDARLHAAFVGKAAPLTPITVTHEHAHTAII